MESVSSSSLNIESVEVCDRIRNNNSLIAPKVFFDEKDVVTIDFYDVM